MLKYPLKHHWWTMIRRPRLEHAYAGWVSTLVGMTFPTLFVVTDSALAQRRPIADNTLGEERSIVTPQENLRGLPGDRIEGGARRGDNLFHSFQEFNIAPSRAVYFDDPGVQNILSRVTGGNMSDIQGTLGVLGDANLFLINPSGIIFGEGARLDVSGSFVASTADSFVFENGFAFSATNPQAPPLLAVSVPIGLQYSSQIPGAITVDQAHLFIGSGQSLILTGGATTLNNGRLIVRDPQGGWIELGSVLGAGTVGPEQNMSTSGGFRVPETFAQAEVVDVFDQIAQTCPTDGDVAGEVGEFVVTGRGGLPADPAEILGGETVLSELAVVEGGETGEEREMGRVDRPSEIANNDQTEIVEAQGWVVGTDGKVMLTAEHSTVEPHSSPITPISCPSS